MLLDYIFLVLVGFIMAALLGQRIIPGILVVAHHKNLFDLPDERKVHNRPIPRLGGVTFFPVIVFVMTVIGLLLYTYLPMKLTFFHSDGIPEFFGLLAGLTLLYVIGIGDDLVGVRYSRKFLIQIVSASMIPLSGLYINNFYGLFGINEIPFFLGIPLTLLLTVFITNAINLIDGIDGLASGLCIVALGMFGVTFALESLWMYTLLAFISVGVIIPFFCYNVYGNVEKGHKIFMGDTGSLTLGFILSVMVVKYCMFHVGDEAAVDGAPLVTAFSILLVPCLDVIRVVLGRIRRKANPFKPDRTHLHHKFLNMGFSARRSLLCIQLMAISFIVVTYVLLYIGVNANIVFVLDVVVWILLNVMFTRKIRQYTSNIITHN